MTRWILILTFAFLCAKAGVSYCWEAQQFPVYTDTEAVNELSREVARKDLDLGERKQRWVEGLQKLHTPHMRLAAMGRGLLALACGLVLAGGFWHWMQRIPVQRRPMFLAQAWAGLWLLNFVGTLVYYQRIQYMSLPGSSGSLTIPIVIEGIRMVAGCGVTGMLLKYLCKGWQLPGSWHWSKPATPGEWSRAALLGLWMVGLVWWGKTGVGYGREGQVVACVGGISLLALVLASKREDSAGKRPVRDILADSEAQVFRYKL